MSNSIFSGLAIKCDTWNQMLQLEEMAVKEGYEQWGFCKEEFDECDMKTFIIMDDIFYSNSSRPHGRTELSFTQFIQSLNQK